MIATPTNMARWLSLNTTALAADQMAGAYFNDIDNLVSEIERTINRPLQPRYLGNCPHIDADRNECKEPVYAKHGEVETTCWKCKTVYNADQLAQRNMSHSNGLHYTAQEILIVMAEMGQPLSERTFRQWRASGKITARNEWGSSEPRFWLNDVVKLRNKHQDDVA